VISLKRWWLRLALCFTRHEAWTVQKTIRHPRFSIFIFFTMSIWFFTIVLPIGALASWALVSDLLWLEIVLGCLAVVASVPVNVWFLRWYMICVSLMFGSPRMALRKQDEVADRLARLGRTLARLH
jgi:hypothetical protein